jgi:hypothetical protein
MNALTLYFPAEVNNIIGDYADEIKPTQRIRKTRMLGDIAQLRWMQKAYILRRPRELTSILEISRLRKTVGYCRVCEFILLVPEDSIAVACRCIGKWYDGCKQEETKQEEIKHGRILFDYALSNKKRKRI